MLAYTTDLTSHTSSNENEPKNIVANKNNHKTEPYSVVETSARQSLDALDSTSR